MKIGLVSKGLQRESLKSLRETQNHCNSWIGFDNVEWGLWEGYNRMLNAVEWHWFSDWNSHNHINQKITCFFNYSKRHCKGEEQEPHKTKEGTAPMGLHSTWAFKRKKKVRTRLTNGKEWQTLIWSKVTMFTDIKRIYYRLYH